MGAKSCQFQEGCQGYDMGLCDDSDACPHANEDGFKRFTVAAQANTVIADIGRGVGRYRYLFTPQEARKLATELINCAGKANLLEGKRIGEETKLDRVNSLFADAARDPYHEKMQAEEALRVELKHETILKGFDGERVDIAPLSKALGKKLEKKAEGEFMEAMGMKPWTSDPAAPSLWEADKEEAVAMDIETPGAEETVISVNIDGKLQEILVVDDPANSELEVKGGKAVEDWWAGVLVGRKGTISGRIDCSKPNEANFKPQPQCICFGPPMDDCPVHGKK